MAGAIYREGGVINLRRARGDEDVGRRISRER